MNILSALPLLCCSLVLHCHAQSTTEGPEEEDHSWVLWADVGARIGFIVICIVCCGLFSLGAFVVCSIHEKCTKNRVTATAAGVRPYALPIWSHSLNMDLRLQGSGFREMSDGFKHYSSHNHLIRQRAGTAITDGARWSVGMTYGKHVFEILWPWGGRGHHSTVGVSTAKAQLRGRGDMSLVGGCGESWGLDIVARRLYHRKRSMSGSCPSDGSYVPDRFFMFVDLDAGEVGFGNDVSFWGFGLQNLPRGQEYFVTVGTSKYNADAQVHYKGTACLGGFDPFSQAGPSQAFPAPPAYPGSNPLPPGYTPYKGGPPTDKMPQDQRPDQVPAPDSSQLYVTPPPAYQYDPQNPSAMTSGYPTTPAPPYSPPQGSNPAYPPQGSNPAYPPQGSNPAYPPQGSNPAY